MYNFTFFYAWYHIPTGKSGVGEHQVPGFDWRDAEQKFLRLLNRWNGQLPGLWQYWQPEGVMPVQNDAVEDEHPHIRPYK